MKKVIIFLILLSFLNVTPVNAQDYSHIFSADPSNNAMPFTHSGLVNRIIAKLISTFDVEMTDYFLSESSTSSSGFTVPLPSIESDLYDTVWAGTEGDELYIYQRLESFDKIDFDTLLTIVQVVEPNINSDELQDFYDDWLDHPEESFETTINGHEFTSYGQNNSNNINDLATFMEIRFNFHTSMFNDNNLVNLSESFYDPAKEFPDIYTTEDSAEEVFVERLYINRILDQIQQTFNFDLTAEHLSAWGNTVYYYPTELATLARLNEVYLFSGETASYQTIELRFTHAYEEDNLDIKANQLLMIESYFHLFAKLLNPELTEEEISIAFDSYIEEGNTELGDIVIRTEGFTDNTISMSRRIRYKLADEQLDYILSVPNNQASQVLIPSETIHEATVPQINPVEKIFAQTNYDYSNIGEVFGSDLNLNNHYNEDVINVLNDLPHHKEVLEISGDISLNSPDNWMVIEPKSEDDFQYEVYIGDLEYDSDKPVEIQGYNFGIQKIERKSLMVIPMTIKQNGQTIYSSGGDINE